MRAMNASSQRQNLLSFVVSHDVANAGQERPVPDRCQRLGPISIMAGFGCPPRWERRLGIHRYRSLATVCSAKQGVRADSVLQDVVSVLPTRTLAHLRLTRRPQPDSQSSFSLVATVDQWSCPPSVIPRSTAFSLRWRGTPLLET